jgi:hypothetical protein
MQKVRYASLLLMVMQSFQRQIVNIMLAGDAIIECNFLKRLVLLL